MNDFLDTEFLTRNYTVCVAGWSLNMNATEHTSQVTSIHRGHWCPQAHLTFALDTPTRRGKASLPISRLR